MPGGKTLIWTLVFLTSTVALDRLIFDYLIFQPANHSGWDSYRWYNFEWILRDAERSFSRLDDPDSDTDGTIQSQEAHISEGQSGPARAETDPLASPGKPLRIIVLGSSIARYSIQKEIMQQLLEQRLQRRVVVQIISHAAMMPEDAYHYVDRINEMEPDLVVYPVAMVDFELEHLMPPHIPGPFYDERAHFEFLKKRVPAQRFYPASFALDHSDRLTLTEIASGFMSGMLAGIRYSDQWCDPLEFNRRASKDKPLRSYIYYQGNPLAGGVYRDGKTSGCVAFPASYAGDVLTFEVPPELYNPDFSVEIEWLSDGSSPLRIDSELARMWEPHWEDRFRYPPSLLEDENVQRQMFFQDPCELNADVVARKTHKPDGSGWQKISLSPEQQKGWIRLRLSHVIWNYRLQPLDKSNRRYGEGLRMPGQFGLKEAPVNQVQHRRWFLEDQRLMELSDQQYLQDYMDRIQPPDWRNRPPVIPFNNLRIVKSFLPALPFKPVPQMARLFNVRERLDAPMLLIMNPENPVESAVFSGSQYFQDFVTYLRKQHSSGFAEIHDELPMQYFADPHHFTYFGMLRMAPRYADLIEAALAHRSAIRSGVQ